MDSASSMLTLTETAAVAGVPVAAVRKEVDRHIVRPRRVKKHLMLPDGAVFYFAFLESLPDGLEVSPPARRELFVLFAHHGSGSGFWERAATAIALKGPTTVTFDTARLTDELEARLRLLRERDARVHSDPGIKGGAPVFKGTRIPVDNVRGQLAAGATVDELVADYPSLTRENVVLADLLNRLGRPRGRPKKFKPLKVRRVKAQ
jgi:uncharacterized protein (DUF433 family)